MNNIATINPIPVHLRATCANCGLPLDPWGCCPRVTMDRAKWASTARRPLYCDSAPDAAEEPFNIHDFERPV
jgi:hypothetical protein